MCGLDWESCTLNKHGNHLACYQSDDRMKMPACNLLAMSAIQIQVQYKKNKTSSITQLSSYECKGRVMRFTSGFASKPGHCNCI